MKKLIVFGGTFDPPHIGHKNLLLSVMEKGFDTALVMPAATPPHKDRRPRDFGERLELCEKTFGDIPGVTVTDIEGRREGKNYTYDTLGVLREEYKDVRIYFLMGSDMLLSIEKWYRFEDILKSTPIVAAARNACDAKTISDFAGYLGEKYGADITVHRCNVIDISSTQLRSELVTSIDEHNAKNLSPSRYAHVMRVAEYAAYLASFHGIDPFDAYVSALAHDCTKYMDEGAQLDYFEKNAILLSEADKNSPKIWHQISGAHFAKTAFGIEDPDMLAAIRYHTTGREDMSALEKLICLADSIEPGRDYEGVEKMREAAMSDLGGALLMSLDRQIDYINERGLAMHPLTIKARDYLKRGKDMDQIELIVKTAVENLYKKKGRDIRILKVDDVTVMADYFVICSGSSNTQLKALAGEVEWKLGELGIQPLHMEGYGSSDWVLLDYGSVIVHVFYRNTRDYYNLERLWADGKEIPITDYITVEEDEADEI